MTLSKLKTYTDRYNTKDIPKIYEWMFEVNVDYTQFLKYPTCLLVLVKKTQNKHEKYIICKTLFDFFIHNKDNIPLQLDKVIKLKLVEFSNTKCMYENKLYNKYKSYYDI